MTYNLSGTVAETAVANNASPCVSPRRPQVNDSVGAIGGIRDTALPDPGQAQSTTSVAHFLLVLSLSPSYGDLFQDPFSTSDLYLISRIYSNGRQGFLSDWREICSR